MAVRISAEYRSRVRRWCFGCTLLSLETKNGDLRIVYLNDTAMSAVQSLRSEAQGRLTDLVFPELTGEQVSLSFHRACVKAGISDFRFHDLRHAAASCLRMQGADIHTVAQLLGHKDLRLAARYQHLSPAFLADAVGRLDGAFELHRHYSVTPNQRAQRGATRKCLELIGVPDGI